MSRVISSVEVIKSFNESNKLGDNTRLISQVDEKVKAQRIRENTILKSNQACPITDIQKHLSSLNVHKFADLVSEQFYNSDVMELTTCTLQAVTQPFFYKKLNSHFSGYEVPDWFGDGIFYQSPNNHGDLELTSRINRWFYDLRQIGEESADGIAMSAKLKDRSIAVLKVPRRPDNENFIHELMVGTHGTNLARKDGVYNFALVWGGFKCPTTVVDPGTKQVISVCGNPWMPDVQYILYENIWPSKAMDVYCETCSASQYFSAMVQIMLATEYGHKTFDWTHYDLHGENVLMREVNLAGLKKDTKHQGEKEFYLPYRIGQKTYYVKATHLATIIDYGRSHIMYENQHFGFGFPEAVTYPDESFPLFDIYKLLMFTSNRLNQTDTEISRVANAFFSYFNSAENIFDAGVRQTDTFYQLPKNDYTTKVLSIMGLLNHLKTTIPEYYDELVKDNVSHLDNGTVLGCDDLMCMSKAEMKNEINIDSRSQLTAGSVYAFFDQKAILKTNGNESDFQRLRTNFGTMYEDAMQRHTQSMNGLIKDYNDLERKIGNPFTPGKILNIEKLEQLGINAFGVANITSIKTMINDIVVLRMTSQRMNTMAAASIDVAYEYGDITTAEGYSGTIKMLQQKEERLMTLLYKMGQSAFYLVDLAKHTSGKTDKDRNLVKGNDWARLILPTYINLISPTTSYQQAKASVFHQKY